MVRPLDVESALVAFLSAALDVPTSTRTPNPRPARFVTVKRIGGRRLNLAQAEPLVMLQGWGTSDFDAFELTRDAWGALDGADGTDIGLGVWISDLNLSGPVNIPDPETGQDRYQFTANMVIGFEESA